MEREEKLVVFDKYDNAVDANIVKGALEASGISAGVISDSTANAVWMAPVTVVVFRRDMDAALRAIYQADMNYEDYQDEMDRAAFDNKQACNKAFAEVALKVHPEIAGKASSDLFARAKAALDAGDLKTLTAMNEQIPIAVDNSADEVKAEPGKIHGWLLLYLVLAVIVDVVAVAMLLINPSMMKGFFAPTVTKISMVAFMVLAACVMTYFLIHAFIHRKPYAAFLGRHHVIVNAVPGACVVAWLGELTSNYILLLFFISLCIWRPFFTSSAQVKALIPPSSRKVDSRLKNGITALYVVIALFCCMQMGFDRWWRPVLMFFLFLTWCPLMDETSSEADQNK